MGSLRSRQRNDLVYAGADFSPDLSMTTAEQTLQLPTGAFRKAPEGLLVGADKMIPTCDLCLGIQNVFFFLAALGFCFVLFFLSFI